MVDRIKAIMNHEDLTPSAFADRLGIGRAVMSHILSGRNNASLDVITRILNRMNYVDADWLLLGKGTMLRVNSLEEGLKSGNSEPQANLFHTVEQEDTSLLPEKECADINSNDINGNKIVTTPIESVSQSNVHNKSPLMTADINLPKIENKKAVKIIIYYSDNSFTAFNPSETSI